MLINSSSFSAALPPPPTPSATPAPVYTDEQLLALFSHQNNFASSTTALSEREWVQRSNSESIQLALRGLCVCTHPLNINVSDRTYDTTLALDSSEDNIIWCNGTTGYKHYNLSSKTMEGIGHAHTNSGFVEFIGDKIFLGTDNGLVSFNASQKVAASLGDVLNVGPRANHLYTVNDDKSLIAFTGLTSDSIKIYNPETSRNVEIPQLRNGRDRQCSGIAFAGDRIVALYMYFSEEGGPHITIHDINGQPIASKDFQTYPASIVADENQVIVYFQDGMTRILDPQTLEEKGCITPQQMGWEDPTNTFNTFYAFHLNEGKLYTVTTSGTFRVFDASTGDLIKALRREDGSPIRTRPKAFSIHGNTIAMGVSLPNEQYAVELWDFEKGKMIHTFPTIGQVDTVKFKMEEAPQLIIGINGGAVQYWSPDVELEMRTAERLEAVRQAAPASPPVEVQRPPQLAQQPVVAPTGFFSKIVQALRWLFSPITALFNWLFRRRT